MTTERTGEASTDHFAGDGKPISDLAALEAELVECNKGREILRETYKNADALIGELEAENKRLHAELDALAEALENLCRVADDMGETNNDSLADEQIKQARKALAAYAAMEKGGK